MSRMQDKYNKEVAPALMEKYNANPQARQDRYKYRYG